MDGLLINVAVAVAALLTGHWVTRWWERARPIVVIRGFTSVISRTERVTCEEELSLLTKQSWYTDQIGKGEAPLGELSDARDAAEGFLALTDGIDTWIREAKETLTKASSSQEVRAGLK